MRRSNTRAAGSLLSVLLVLGCQQPAAQSAELTEEDKTEIRGLFTTVVNTLRARDWDGFLATFADDVVFHPANSPALQGKDALKTWVSSGPGATQAFDFTNVQVFGEGNLAYGTSDINMALEGIPVDKGKQLVVLRKNAAGEWKTVAVSFNSDTPMPGAGAPPLSTTTAQ
jgi:uncharacterized protein (TIGR02246 family)